MAVRKLTDVDILRVARLTCTESAANTFTEQELDTQLSVERGVIWLIHFIEFNYLNLDVLTEVAANSVEAVSAQITRATQSAILPGNNSELIQLSEYTVGRSSAIGTDAGPLYIVLDSIRRFDYPIPLPYASQSIFLGVLGTDASATHRVDVRIGYTIAEVSDEFFFRVAQALIA